MSTARPMPCADETTPLQPTIGNSSIRVSLMSSASDGVAMSLKFTDMDVDTPAASIRTNCKADQDVNFFDGGGNIINWTNGTSVRFVGMEGVYLLTLKTETPNTSSASTSGFTRQEP